ncbi:hypothetical protein FNU79_15795 [Deinococcus detaillensis]|uniref:Uncharacterized protein n=1 Tax=Deinococcus detaillensis TaxID=2592048 RepID=A0A553UM55_9DEIO|nr:hypothetical protein [Deinococcus detaillensis]TSA81091.1 hypothetical protein FNU79_15795 [Deinococcus detaillensis]
MTWFYLLTSILMGLALLALLLRPDPQRPLTLWLLAALLPVLVAVTAAMFGQAQAQRTLSAFNPALQDRALAWRDAGGSENTSTLSLGGLDAACVVRAAQRGGTYQLSNSTLFVPHGAQLLGPWPSRAESDALMLSGQLNCRRVSVAGE